MADAETQIVAKMQDAGLPQPAIDMFLTNFRRLLQGDRGLIREADIDPVEALPRLEAIEETPAAEDLLEKLVIIKLNGGLGASMGLDRPKSLIPVRENYTFLDLVALQTLHLRRHTGKPVPGFYLMNSYRTRTASLRLLAKYPELGAPDDLDFVQNQVPKLQADTLEPIEWPENPELEWCPPGHGDFYPALLGSGLLDRLLNRGVLYAFVSNVDNLGAGVDSRILGRMAARGIDFLMEVAQRTSVDRKGGHLARRKGTGRFVLRESAQCPEEESAAFQDIQRHRYFNTNNLWIRLDRLKELLERHGGALALPLIVNAKPVDPTRPDSPKVYQLETAMGAAIELFNRAEALVVPRTRFAPVKTTADLLAVRSDAYELTHDYHLILAPDRSGRPPQVNLDSKHYKILGQFEAFFPEGSPSLRRCDRFVAEGPLIFRTPLVCEGKEVRFVNPAEQVRSVGPGVYPGGRYEILS